MTFQDSHTNQWGTHLIEFEPIVHICVCLEWGLGKSGLFRPKKDLKSVKKFLKVWNKICTQILISSAYWSFILGVDEFSRSSSKFPILWLSYRYLRVLSKLETPSSVTLKYCYEELSFFMISKSVSQSVQNDFIFLLYLESISYMNSNSEVI